MTTLAELATLGVLLAVVLTLAATMLVCARPRPRRCDACARRISGRHRPDAQGMGGRHRPEDA